MPRRDAQADAIATRVPDVKRLAGRLNPERRLFHETRRRDFVVHGCLLRAERDCDFKAPEAPAVAGVQELGLQPPPDGRGRVAPHIELRGRRRRIVPSHEKNRARPRVSNQVPELDEWAGRVACVVKPSSSGCHDVA